MSMRVAMIAAAAIALAGFAANAAQSPQKPVPPRTYADACGVCHDNRGYGVQVLADRLGDDGALIHKRNMLEPDMIRMIVRQGLGAMPPMSKLEVSGPELDAIIAYLATARVDDGESE